MPRKRKESYVKTQFAKTIECLMTIYPQTKKRRKGREKRGRRLRENNMNSKL